MITLGLSIELSSAAFPGSGCCHRLKRCFQRPDHGLTEPVNPAPDSAAGQRLEILCEPPLIKVDALDRRNLLKDPRLCPTQFERLIYRDQLDKIVEIVNYFCFINAPRYQNRPNGQLEFDQERKKLVDIVGALIMLEYSQPRSFAKTLQGDFTELEDVAVFLRHIKLSGLWKFDEVRAELIELKDQLRELF